VNKRSAILVAAGLAVSLATGFVAFLNGGLGPVDAATRPSPVVERPRDLPASTHRASGASGTALADRREAARSGGASHDD
jgi:hypothetical protein